MRVRRRHTPSGACRRFRWNALDRVLHLRVVDALRARRCCELEALAQQRHVGVLHAELEDWAVGQPHDGLGLLLRPASHRCAP